MKKQVLFPIVLAVMIILAVIIPYSETTIIAFKDKHNKNITTDSCYDFINSTAINTCPIAPLIANNDP